MEGFAVAEEACWPRHGIGPPFIGHKSNNAMPYDTRADTELRQNDTNAWNPAPFPFLNPPNSRDPDSFSVPSSPLILGNLESWKIEVECREMG